MALRGKTTTVCSGRIQQEGDKSAAVTRRCSPVADIRIPNSSFPTEIGESSGPKTDEGLHAKSPLSLQSIVYKATSSILQVSRADGRSHRRSEVDRRRRPDYEVRRRGPVLCASESLLDRF